MTFNSLMPLFSVVLKNEALQHCQYPKVKDIIISSRTEDITQRELSEKYQKIIKKNDPVSVFNYQFAPHTETSLDAKSEETQEAPRKDLKKLHFLFSAVNKLLMVKSNIIPCDSRDSMQSKSVQPAGDSLGILIRQIFRSHGAGY